MDKVAEQPLSSCLGHDLSGKRWRKLSKREISHWPMPFLRSLCHLLPLTAWRFDCGRGLKQHLIIWRWCSSYTTAVKLSLIQWESLVLLSDHCTACIQNTDPKLRPGDRSNSKSKINDFTLLSFPLDSYHFHNTLRLPLFYFLFFY